MEFTVKNSKRIETVTANAEGYNLTGTVTIKKGKIIKMSGYVEGTTANPDNIRFDSRREGDELKTTYYNFADDDRHILSIFNELIDSVVTAYEK
ncbi:MAG: hypothetical protein IKV75_00425 [Bacteroidales bacterium]|nr:hypothetical protein [Bacteroidales bacterium]